MVDDIAEKAYNSFIVNRGLSYFYDTALIANEMNIHHQLDNRMQFDFLRGVVRKRKRFSKWNKATKAENIDIVKNYWGYSTAKAEQVLPLLSDEQLEKIKTILSVGGRKGR